MTEKQTHHPSGDVTGIPPRSRQANQDLVDLSEAYTASLDADWLGKAGANLAALPGGVQVFAGVAFDVRGVIQLAGARAADAGLALPQSVAGIEVHHTGRTLHFLHGAAWSAEDGTEIGAYVLHYADGRSWRLPLVYGRNVKDWWVRDGDAALTDAEIAWSGENDAARKAGCGVQVYVYTANSPYPGVEIATIDFVSSMAAAAPFLIALTVEPLAPTYEGGFHKANIDVFCPIPPRSPKAGPDLVDLSDHYTSSLDDNWFHHAGHDLRDLPQGVQALGGVPFDVRGLVQLSASKMLDVTGTVFPEAVTGIRVNRKGARLHFLQGCFWSTEVGAKLGEYVIHYADGQTRTAPILYGRNIFDWWLAPDEAQLVGARSVWHGENPATRSMGLKTHLIDYTWENPLPDVEISSIDFVSDLIEAGPFLVALTITG